MPYTSNQEYDGQPSGRWVPPSAVRHPGNLPVMSAAWRSFSDGTDLVDIGAPRLVQREVLESERRPATRFPNMWARDDSTIPVAGGMKRMPRTSEDYDPLLEKVDELLAVKFGAGWTEHPTSYREINPARMREMADFMIWQGDFLAKSNSGVLADHYTYSIIDMWTKGFRHDEPVSEIEIAYLDYRQTISWHQGGACTEGEMAFAAAHRLYDGIRANKKSWETTLGGLRSIASEKHSAVAWMIISNVLELDWEARQSILLTTAKRHSVAEVAPYAFAGVRDLNAITECSRAGIDPDIAAEMMKESA